VTNDKVEFQGRIKVGKTEPIAPGERWTVCCLIDAWRTGVLIRDRKPNVKSKSIDGKVKERARVLADFKMQERAAITKLNEPKVALT